jgi:hypothetical protein
VLLLPMAERLSAQRTAAQLAAVLDRGEVEASRAATARWPLRVWPGGAGRRPGRRRGAAAALSDRLALHLSGWLRTPEPPDLADWAAARGRLAAVQAGDAALTVLVQAAQALGIGSLRARCRRCAWRVPPPRWPAACRSTRRPGAGRAAGAGAARHAPASAGAGRRRTTAEPPPPAAPDRRRVRTTPDRPHRARCAGAAGPGAAGRAGGAAAGLLALLAAGTLRRPAPAAGPVRWRRRSGAGGRSGRAAATRAPARGCT